MKKLLLNLWFWPVFVAVTAVGLALVPILCAGNAVTFRYPVRRGIRIGVRLYGRVLIAAIRWAAPVTLEDRSGGIAPPVVFVANHHSSADPYLFGMLPLEMAFVTSWPFRIPVYRWIMGLAGYLNTAERWERLADKGRRLLASGCSLIVWPEGHRSRDGRMRRFRNGAFRLAVQAGCPVVPVCIWGTERFLPPGHRALSPAAVRMTVLPAIAVPDDGRPAEEAIRTLRDRAYAAIVAELVAQVGESAPVAASPPGSPRGGAVAEVGGHG
jgi:1-acyl-sn-glycerol-3-phosphate acyltransferase